MKTVISIFVMLTGFLGFTFVKYIFTEPGPLNANIERAHLKKKSDSARIAKFLVEMADARLMDMEEGKLAKERGTTQEIKNYGQLMLDEQPKLMAKLKTAAANAGVILPTALSNEKAEGLEKLKQKNGDDFDKKFMKMMKIDHKRDIRIMKKAMRYDNAHVKNFATENLPVVQMHLNKLEEVKHKH